MALDQQRNWDISMAENLEKVMRNAHSARNVQNHENDTKSHQQPEAEPPRTWTTEPLYLPDEILVQILDYVSRFQESQYTLASCCLLSRQWYSTAVAYLYRSPYLYGKNFDPFAQVIVPSLNLHIRKSHLAELVRDLDMSRLVHQASKRITARLLGRTKDNLEAFRAPVASFGSNCQPALSKCHRLRYLDLSLVSESPPLLDLLKTVSHLESLTTFRLPRSSGFSTNASSTIVWPPNLENLSISGGIDSHFMHGVVTFPQTLRSLTIAHCPMAKGFALLHLLRNAVRPLPNLETLKVAHCPRLVGSSLNDVLLYLPGLTKLSVSVDYITPAVFDLNPNEWTIEAARMCAEIAPVRIPSPRHRWTQGRTCQLRTLELSNSGNPGVEDKISPIDVLIAIDEGTLPELRNVRAAKSLMWHTNAIAEDAEALADRLKESAGNRDGTDGAETGVWTVDDRILLN